MARARKKGPVARTDSKDERGHDDPLWHFPTRLPALAPGEELDLVALMAQQVADHPPGTRHHVEAKLELLHVLSLSLQLDAAVELLDELIAQELPEARRCDALMLVGACAERAKRFDLAVRLYRMAVDVSREDDAWGYFSRNNLAYSLNQLGEFEEGASFARQAIQLSPEQFNAHKNLAVALEGLGQLEQAAESYLRSTYLEPFDQRAYRSLVDMVERHPELLEKLDYLASEIEFCKSPMRVLSARKH